MTKSRIHYYNSVILELLRKGIISSITINDVLFDDYNDIIKSNIQIKNIKINKKYIKLFKDEKFIIKNYIPYKETIVKNNKTGKYHRLMISSHARVRFITRYIILTLKMHEIQNKYLFNILQENFISKLTKKDLSSISEFKKRLNVFIQDNKKLLDLEIYKMFIESTRVKNLSKIFKYRQKQHGDTNYYVNGNFLLVYDVKSFSIKTVEIKNMTKNYIEKSKTRKLNKDAHDYSEILKIILNYLLRKNKSLKQ